MKKIYFIYLILYLLIANTFSSFAQNIITAQDTAVLIACAKMPITQAEYKLSFTANHFDLNYQNKEEEKSESIELLIQKIESNHKDYKTARKIVDYYRKQNNEKKFMYYYEPFYSNVYEDYLAKPNDFETVDLFCILLQETQNIEGLFAVWEQFTSDNPKEKRGLTTYALQLAMKGELSKARQLTQQAYDLDIQNNDVYVTAMMCEFASTVLALGEIMNSNLDDATKNKQIEALRIDETFFKKAISNKAPVAAQMALDATNLLLIYYRSVFSISSQSIGTEKIFLKPNSNDDKLLKAIEKRALAQLKKKHKNLHFAHKTLCTIAILRGNELKATAQWSLAGSHLENDSEVFRLLSFGYLLKKDFKNAILFAEKILDVNYEDVSTLGRLYTLNNEYEKAFFLFSEMLTRNPSDQRAFASQMSILIQSYEFDKAIAYMYGILLEYTDDIELVHYNYYKAVATLIRGDKNDAFKRLKAIHAESEYKEVANKLLEYFFD